MQTLGKGKRGKGWQGADGLESEKDISLLADETQSITEDMFTVRIVER